MNFDESIMDSTGGVCFVIKDPNSRLVAAGGSCLFGPSVLKAELRTVWTSIIYARLILRADPLIIQDNSYAMIG